jgi:hypothetical protein
MNCGVVICRCWEARVASFWWSQSRNAMQLRLQFRLQFRLRLKTGCSTWIFFKKCHKLNGFIFVSIRIYNNFHYKESDVKKVRTYVKFCFFKNCWLAI